MSASRERKMRTGNEAAPAKKKKKISENVLIIGVMVLVLALVFGGMAIARGYWRNATAVTVGDHKISNTEFNYFYHSQVNSIANYASSLGISNSEGLDKQYISSSSQLYLTYFGLDTELLTDATADAEGNYDVTWAQLFADNAQKAAVKVYAVYDEAVKNGYELDEEGMAEVDEAMESLKTEAATYGYDVDDFVELAFGKGCDVDGYRDFVILNQTVAHYPETVRAAYTAEDVSARYDEDPGTFDSATIHVYSVSASDVAGKDDEGNANEITDEVMAEAKKKAEDMAADFDETLEGVSTYADYTKTVLTSYTTEEAAEWALGAKAGDVKVFTKEIKDSDDNVTNTIYYVVHVVTNEDYNVANGYAIYIADDVESEETEETEETTEEAEPTAEEKLADIDAALAADASKEGFLSMVTKYSNEEDSTFTDTGRSSFTSYPELAAWLFNDTHTNGDWTKIAVAGGTYYLWFDSYGESYRDLTVKATLANEWLENLYAAAAETATYDESVAMHASVSIY